MPTLPAAVRRLFRPSALLVLAAAVLLGAAAFVVRPLGRGAPTRAVPRPVPAGDQEVAWLNAATSAVGWERFVAAVHRLKAERPDLGIDVRPEANPFPAQTAEVPELAISIAGAPGRLWFRWYKLTGDLGTPEWVRALTERNPPPLAIIGGGSSDRARDLAEQLQSARERPATPSPQPTTTPTVMPPVRLGTARVAGQHLRATPLLLMTTATAELVSSGDPLMSLYPERSFRFCFTNRQIAEAVASFAWAQPDLRPDGEPVYGVRWEDDPYSEDLFSRFHEVLGPEGYFRVSQRARLLREVAGDVAWLAGHVAARHVPPGLDLEGFRRGNSPPPTPFFSAEVKYSEGSFDRPNRWEADVAEKLVDELAAHPGQRRPLLVLPATPQPARRLLRALLRTAPAEAGRFTVLTGDAIDFNTVYRDRRLAWPIQDLPVTLVLFCHRNPVDSVSFRPEGDRADDAAPDPFGQTSTGTQDLLLYRDILAALAEPVAAQGRLPDGPDALAAALRAGRRADGQPLFDADGNPPSGAGEFVVSLRPVRQGERVLPRARLQVWQRGGADGGPEWRPVPVPGPDGPLPELTVRYGPAERTPAEEPE